MSVFNLNRWLRKTPQPVAVMADDKRVEVPKHGRGWRDLTQTIEAMEPNKLTAVDGQGNVIRSINMETDEKGDASVNPEMSDVQLFAKLISEAYDKGSKVNEPLIAQIMLVLDRQSASLAKANGDNERLRLESHKLRAQILELSAQLNAPVESDEGSIIGAIAAAAMQGQSDAIANSGATPIKQGAKK
jgi:hypothetical protein